MYFLRCRVHQMDHLHWRLGRFHGRSEKQFHCGKSANRKPIWLPYFVWFPSPFPSLDLIYLCPSYVIPTGPHVDSIKFSGDLVAGLSLGTERTMVMTKDRNDGAPLTENRVTEYDSLPERYEFPLKRRSLYIMTGLWRYNYSHEITRAIEPAASTSRRISIIFRNEKHNDLMLRAKKAPMGM